MPDTPPTSQLQEEFDDYFKAVFPHMQKDGNIIYDQLRLAFFSGCLVAYTTPQDLWPELVRWREALEMNVSFLTPTGRLPR